MNKTVLYLEKGDMWIKYDVGKAVINMRAFVGTISGNEAVSINDFY